MVAHGRSNDENNDGAMARTTPG